MKYDKLYMEIAIRMSQESKCPRKKVGAVVVTSSQALFPGYNGHASGGPNEWEDIGEPNLEVIHAEHNCLNKMLEEGVSAKGSTIYTTLSCCLQCAKQLVGAKVKRVVYLEQYRDTIGLEYLRKYGVEVERLQYETS
jgi:dCMP deaminase